MTSLPGPLVIRVGGGGSSFASAHTTSGQYGEIVSLAKMVTLKLPLKGYLVTLKLPSKFPLLR